MYRLLKQTGVQNAVNYRLCMEQSRHRIYEVGTVAAIKGAVSTMDLKEIGTQVGIVKHVSSACTYRGQTD